MLERAEQVLRMAMRGWPLFPLLFREKRPLVTDWPNQATVDQSRIQVWLKELAGCNWGVVTGPASGIFVLDVDGELGQQSLRELEYQGHMLPKTLIARTGSGAHFYLKYPSNGAMIRNSAGKIAPGLDVRGDGGYVVVPPSVHPSGRAYEWLDFDAAIESAPAWLLQKVTAEPLRDNAAPRAQIGILPEGRRNDGLTRLAGALRRCTAE
jgi:hypothetical protein